MSTLPNATFFDSHVTDCAPRVSYAIDLTPLTLEAGPSVDEFAEEVLEQFNQSIRAGI